MTKKPSQYKRGGPGPPTVAPRLAASVPGSPPRKGRLRSVEATPTVGGAGGKAAGGEAGDGTRSGARGDMPILPADGARGLGRGRAGAFAGPCGGDEVPLLESSHEGPELLSSSGRPFHSLPPLPGVEVSAADPVDGHAASGEPRADGAFIPRGGAASGVRGDGASPIIGASVVMA
mmetsp:Transcript_107884/g.310850  ORF Transcript_107884/g.310850 Transcript_107884/m.310850 type:complete len:176 (+) Transcript_107884:1177-1704(+)